MVMMRMMRMRMMMKMIVGIDEGVMVVILGGVMMMMGVEIVVMVTGEAGLTALNQIDIESARTKLHTRVRCWVY